MRATALELTYVTNAAIAAKLDDALRSTAKRPIGRRPRHGDERPSRSAGIARRSRTS